MANSRRVVLQDCKTDELDEVDAWRLSALPFKLVRPAPEAPDFAPST